MLINIDFCFDLLSEKKYEFFVRKVINLPIGHWRPVHELIALSDCGYEMSLIFVSWVCALDGDEEFPMILFCEEDSMRIVSASYNVKAILARDNDGQKK